MKRIAFLVNAQNPTALALFRRSLENAATLTKTELQEYSVGSAHELPEAFNAMAKAGVDGTVVAEDSLFVSNASAIGALAVAKRIPASGFPHLVDAGGLLGYGADRTALFARTSYFVDRILKGMKPSELPYERATKFGLVVNLKTAKALGLAIPQTVLVRADRAIG